MLKKESLQDLAKKADESIDRFEKHIETSLPEGLNSKLSRPERSILKTYIMWMADQQPTESNQ
jgi:hypothetical protein